MWWSWALEQAAVSQQLSLQKLGQRCANTLALHAHCSSKHDVASCLSSGTFGPLSDFQQWAEGVQDIYNEA